MADLDDVLNDVGVAEVVVKLKKGIAPLSLGASTSRGRGLSLVARRASAGAAEADAVTALPSVMSLFISRDDIGTPALAAGNGRSGAGLAARGTSLAAVESRRTPPTAALYPKLGLAVGLVDRSGAAALRNHGAVESVILGQYLRLIRPVHAAAAKPNSIKSITWGLQRLKIPALWNAGHKGKGVVVGHLDTGVDSSHPALKGAIAAFAEFDFNGNITSRTKGIDSGDHGTHTAGTIVGRVVKGKSFGVAPEAKLASALVIEGGDALRRILSGMEWLIAQDARLLSMSLGFPGYTPAFKVIIQALRDNNILPIVAVGNEGPNTSRSPGNYPDVVSVGAMDVNDRVADFSGSQRFARADDPIVPDVVAPGVNVVSAVPNRQFAAMDGSSMATPHVAGLAALLLGAKPTATLAELENALIGSCRLPSGMRADRGGAGVPDGVEALRILGVPLSAGSRSPTRSKPKGRQTPKARRPKKAASRKRAA